MGYINLCVTARCGRIHGRDNKLDVRPKFRPLLPAEHNDGDLSAGEILLTAHVFVGRYQHVKTGGFSGAKQFAVFELAPPLVCGSSDGVTFQKRAEWDGRWLVE
ncbi:MAG: hypothetical protein ACLQOO_17300 [Terriglobia bacterium]